jgi:hypothetical protein
VHVVCSMVATGRGAAQADHVRWPLRLVFHGSLHTLVTAFQRPARHRSAASRGLDWSPAGAPPGRRAYRPAGGHPEGSHKDAGRVAVAPPRGVPCQLSLVGAHPLRRTGSGPCGFGFWIGCHLTRACCCRARRALYGGCSADLTAAGSHAAEALYVRQHREATPWTKNTRSSH